MKFWTKKRTTIFLLLSIAFFFIALFYFDLNKKINISDEESIGTVSFKLNTIQRKFFSSVVWRKADSETKLKNKDTIRTFSESDAKIKLKDGTEIEIDENSMIFLDTENNSPNIKFQGGALTINKKNSTKDSDITVDYKGQKLKLNDGSAKIETNENGLKVNVKEGKATLLDKNGSKDINENETAESTKNGINISSPSIILSTPLDQEKFLLFQNKTNINFSWLEKIPLTRKKISVSQFRDFSSSNQISVNSNSYSLNLAQGNYYWKVIGFTSSGELKISDTNKFVLIKETEFKSQMPAENSSYQNNQHIRFKWNEMQNVRDYSLEIAKSRDFSQDLKIFTVKTNSYSVSELSDSVYYWRVISRSSINGIPDSISPVKKILIGNAKEEISNEAVSKEENSNEAVSKKENSDEKKKSDLVLIFPKTNSTLKFPDDKKTISFSWNEKEISKFELSKDKNFNEILVSKELNTNSFSFNFIKDGTYFWRVSNKAHTKNSLFNLILNDLGKQGVVQLISPIKQEIDLSKTKSILFKWKSIDKSNSYKLIIKTLKGKVLITKNLNQSEFKLDNFSKLSEGKFIWEVISTDLKYKNLKPSASSFEINLSSDPLKKLKPEEIKVISPETIYRE